MTGYTFFLIFLVVVTVGAENPKTCKDPTPVSSFNENECWSKTWYLYARSVKCDQCCVYRTMTAEGSDKVTSYETISCNGTSTNVSCTCTKSETQTGVFYMPDDADHQKPQIILGTDCKTYIVMYSKRDCSLNVFTSGLDQEIKNVNSLEEVKRCGMQLHKCNPNKMCQ